MSSHIHIIPSHYSIKLGPQIPWGQRRKSTHTCLPHCWEQLNTAPFPADPVFSLGPCWDVVAHRPHTFPPAPAWSSHHPGTATASPAHLPVSLLPPSPHSHHGVLQTIGIGSFPIPLPPLHSAAFPGSLPGSLPVVLHLPCCLGGSRGCCVQSCGKELPVSMESVVVLGKDTAWVMPGWKCWRCRCNSKRSHPRHL